MANDLRQVQRVRFAVESTFGADATGDVAANFDDLRCKPTAIVPETAIAADETAVQYFHEQRDYVRGPERGSCAIDAYWTSVETAISESVTTTKMEQSKFLETILGGYGAPGQGSLVASGAATTGCVVTASEGSQFTDNSFVGLSVSGVFYPRLVATVSTDTLVWWPALPAAVSVGAVVHNAQNIYYDESLEKWLQILAESRIDRGNIFLLSGGAGDLSMTLARGGLVTWASTVKGALREHDDEIATPQGGGALAAAAFTDSIPTWGHSGGFHLAPTTDSTLTPVRLWEISVDFGIKWIEVPDPQGVEGMGEWHRDRGEKIIELTIERDAAGGAYELYRDAYRAGTDYGMLYWLGGSGGEVRAIGARTCQIQKEPEPVVYQGMEALKLTLLGKLNSQGTDLTTAVRRSPIVLGHL